jgi:4-amino-4-deoxychorismate lyase
VQKLASVIDPPPAFTLHVPHPHSLCCNKHSTISTICYIQIPALFHAIQAPPFSSTLFHLPSLSRNQLDKTSTSTACNKMVKFYSTSYSYDYSFPAVSLAYFLRYPNPHSTHVLSTDVIDREYDPDTQRLTTVRLHLKRSKLPTAILKLLPRSLIGAGEDGDSQSYILETTVVDVKEGWMQAESRNLEWTGVLSVIEKQVFRRHAIESLPKLSPAPDLYSNQLSQKTDVITTVTLQSRIGENLRRRKAQKQAEAEAAEEEAPPAKMGFFKSWAASPMQRSIEVIGLRRAEKSQPKAKEGMTVVLERLRQGGLVAVLEGMRRDRELMFTGGPAWTFPTSTRDDKSPTVNIDVGNE